MPQEEIESPVFKPEPGERIRILIEYCESWRPIFWFQISRDGSVYLGPRNTEIIELRHGVAKRSDGQLRVSYADGTAITDPEVRKQAKLSFHASGLINTPAGRLARSSLRSLNAQELLCLALFQHPREFASVDTDAVKQRDVCLRYPVDEVRPLSCHVYVAPKEKTQLVVSADADFQINPVFEYSDLDGVPDSVVQLVLGHGAEGPWPPYSYLLFPAFAPREGDANA